MCLICKPTIYSREITVVVAYVDRITILMPKCESCAPNATLICRRIVNADRIITGIGGCR